MAAIIESSAEKAMPRGSRNGRLYAAAENGTATAVQQGIYRVKSPESTKKPSSRTALCGGEGGIRILVWNQIAYKYVYYMIYHMFFVTIYTT